MLFCVYGSYAHDCSNSSRCSLFAKVPFGGFQYPKGLKKELTRLELLGQCAHKK